MTPLEKERLTAALELCGCVEGLILNGMVPDYAVDYLRSRLRNFRKLYGVPTVHLITREDVESS